MDVHRRDGISALASDGRGYSAGMTTSATAPAGWSTERLTSVPEVLDVFLDLRGRRWFCRGQPRAYGNLRPGIDRILEGRARREKLDFERRSISFLRQNARFFSGAGEQHAMTDDFVALMVLQHYKFRTRLLDWSASPYVAAFFATSDECSSTTTTTARSGRSTSRNMKMSGAINGGGGRRQRTRAVNSTAA